MNYIWYRPGLGGNFLQRLFALSDHTQFLWTRGTCGCRPLEFSFAERWRWYYYREDFINHWMHEAHLVPSDLQLAQTIGNNWQTEPIMITAGHYWLSINKFDPLSEPDSSWRLLDDSVDQRYFYVDANQETQDLLQQFLHLDQMKGMDLELKAEAWLQKSLGPEPISMDAILGSQEQFCAEYQRVCSLMAIDPIDLDKAWQFQQNWRRLRVDNAPPGLAVEDKSPPQASKTRVGYSTWADIKRSR